jgi:hypothetical protein
VSATANRTRVRGRAGVIASWQAIIDELCQRDVLTQVGLIGALMDIHQEMPSARTSSEPDVSGAADDR